MRKGKNAHDDEVDEVNEEDEISWEVPKDLEDIVEEIVADLMSYEGNARIKIQTNAKWQHTC